MGTTSHCSLGALTSMVRTLALVSADNPASNGMGGFKESASATCHCRQCLGTSEETKQKVQVYGSVSVVMSVCLIA